MGKNKSSSRHHAGDIRRQAAAELKTGAASSPHPGDRAQQQLLAAAIGRTSVQYARHAPAPPPPAAVQATPPTNAHSRLAPVPSTSSVSSGSPSLAFASSATDNVEPLDYEDFVAEQARSGQRDPLAHTLEFPQDDLEVKVLPRKIRSMGHILPEEPLDKLDAVVQSCVDCYTSDFVLVRRKHAPFHKPTEEEEEDRLRLLDSTPAHDFEVDDTPEVTPDYENVSVAVVAHSGSQHSFTKVVSRRRQSETLATKLERSQARAAVRPQLCGRQRDQLSRRWLT